MPRKREGTDGELLEWAIQGDYKKSAEKLGKHVIAKVIEFHKGNANGGRTFMTDGVPDTMTLYKWQGKWCQLWIEFKRHNGHLSDSQKDMIDLLYFCGVDVIVCHDEKSALDALQYRLEFGQPKESK